MDQGSGDWNEEWIDADSSVWNTQSSISLLTTELHVAESSINNSGEGMMWFSSFLNTFETSPYFLSILGVKCIILYSNQ